MWGSKEISFSKILQILYIAVVLILMLTILLPDYLPMADLPQHAAQVATLDDLLKHQSPWHSFLEINWNTPYLIGYVSWLILYQLFDIVLAGKLVLALAFSAYVVMMVYLRKSFQASSWVDWIALPSFFGLAYEWGFFTYLVALPIGLYFFWLSKHLVEKKEIQFKHTVLIMLIGTAMHYAHMLIFLFFCLLAFVYIVSVLFLEKRLLNQSKFKNNSLYFLPYIWFSVLLFLYVNRVDPLVEAYYGPSQLVTVSWQDKLHHLMYMPWHMAQQEVGWTMISIVLVLLPWVSGYRISHDKRRCIPFLIFLIVWLVLPSHISHTSLIYQRYALFGFIFYYLLFDLRSDVKYRKMSEYGGLFLAVCLLPLLGKIAYNHYHFHHEVKDFQKILATLPSAQRILYLQTHPFELEASHLTSLNEYVYFGSWYQAQKQGWVDFNFAWYPPQIVRFKVNSVPEVRRYHQWNSVKALKEVANCKIYDLILFKSKEQDNFVFFDNGNCVVKWTASEGDWHILKVEN